MDINHALTGSVEIEQDWCWLGPWGHVPAGAAGPVPPGARCRGRDGAQAGAVGQCKVRESFIGSNDLEWNDLIEIQ